MKRRVVQAAVGVLGVLALVLGLLQGDYTDTLRKAIMICMECIGLG